MGRRVLFKREVSMIEFPLKDGSAWTLTSADVKAWESVYRFDVLHECRKAWLWVEASPSRRKTARGMRKFLVTWLNRADESRATARPVARDWRPQPTPVASDVMAQIMAAAEARERAKA